MSVEHPNIKELTDILSRKGTLKGWRPRTIQHYTKLLRAYYSWLKEKKHIKPTECSLTDIQDYIVMITNAGHNKSYLNNIIVFIKTLHRDILRTPTLDDGDNWKDVIPHQKQHKTSKHSFTEEELNKFWNLIHDPFDKLYYRLMYYRSLRVSEPREILTTTHVTNDPIITKGGKLRYLHIHETPHLIREIDDYLLWRNTKYPKKRANSKYLFPGRTARKPVGITTMQTKFKTYLKTSGIQKKLTPHRLKNSWVTHAFQKELPPDLIQETAGHTDIKTTYSYKTEQSMTHKEFFSRFDKKQKE